MEGLRRKAKIADRCAIEMLGDVDKNLPGKAQKVCHFGSDKLKKFCWMYSTERISKVGDLHLASHAICLVSRKRSVISRWATRA